ncbi:MAG: RNA polymerase sigma factor FliA [Burkholderiaceae bacterium]|nr:RNA polymerase sigma factor FliA [Burkholderiaceae bacterium]
MPIAPPICSAWRCSCWRTRKPFARRGSTLRYHAPTTRAAQRHLPRATDVTYTAKGQLDRDALLRQHVPLVRRLAHHMIAKLPANVEIDDLIQVGMIGLSDALTRFEATQGVQFETFATQRIRGAMLDELREADWMSRSSRKSQKDIEKAVQRLEQKLGRSPLESEIAQELEMSLSDYQSLLGKVRGTQLVYLEDMTRVEGEEGEGFLERHETADAPTDPMAMLRDQRLRNALVLAIEALPEREQHIMGMYYEQDMNLKEIAAVLGVTESRVCQLHSQSIARLRARMRSH